MTSTELATVGEVQSGCEVASLTKSKGQTKSGYNLALSKKMPIVLWRHGLTLSLGTATSQLYVTQSHLNVLWMTKSLETLLAWGFSPLLFGETHSMSSRCIKASRRKTEDGPYAAVCGLKANQLPQRTPRITDSACRDQRDRLLPWAPVILVSQS